jgi:hypothetical protein
MKYAQALKIIEKQENTWYCGTCKRFFKSGNYCFENHFDKKHPEINWRQMTTDDTWRLFSNFSWNKNNVRTLVKRLLK